MEDPGGNDVAVRVIRASSEEEMVAVFLRGEFLSSRFSDTVRAALARTGSEEALILHPDLASERENALRREILGAARGFGRGEGLFAGFPDDVRWERAALSAADVLAIRYIAYDYWVELSGGSRRPLDAAKRIRAGVTVFGVPNDDFLVGVEEVATAPPLIVVGGDDDGRVVLEGHVRLTTFALAPERLPTELEVLHGRSPRIGEWALW